MSPKFTVIIPRELLPDLKEMDIARIAEIIKPIREGLCRFAKERGCDYINISWVSE